MTEFEQPKSLEEALLVIERLNVQVVRQSRRLDNLERRMPTGLVKAFCSRLFPGRNAETGSEMPSDLRLVAESGIFDCEFYRKQLELLGKVAPVLDDPIRHYLEKGVLEGLDPGPGFDSDWYLVANPDVKSSGVNPLLHYILHGKDEGRLPKHGAHAAAENHTPDTTAGYNSRMWNGFMHRAWPELQHRADRLFDARASWNLAAWLFAHGDVESAQEHVNQSVAHSPDGASRRALVGLGKCYSLLGEYRALQSMLSDAESTQRLGSTLPYLQANAWHGDDAKRLACINEIFFRAGLSDVVRKCDSAPLALDNLSSAEEYSEGELVALADNPQVSVIIPVFNASETLQIALDGLLEQSLRSLEVIVVDDGSTDNTAEVACRYSERDPRVRYIANDINMGAYPTRNNGMKAARGQFVTVHDSDDWSHPQKLERQLQPLLKDESKVASFSSWVRVLGDLTFVGPWLLNETFIEKNHSSALVRRSALDVVGLWDSVNVAADTEFLGRLEHHYGHQAIVHVLPGAPLSFALSDDTTLTRTKATHVKTIHYGLRRVYREAARWWHRQADNKPVMAEGDARPFPIPLGISRNTSRKFDCILVADFAVSGEKLNYTLAAIESRVTGGECICLFHWPDYRGWHGAVIADEVFALCQRLNIGFAHVGLTVSAPLVVMLDEALWAHPPTQVVQVDGLERVEKRDGSVFEQQGALKVYFSNGGDEFSTYDQVT